MDATSRLSFDGADVFTVSGIEPPRNTAVLQAQIGARIADNVSLDIGYSGEFGSGAKSNAVRISLTGSF